MSRLGQKVMENSLKCFRMRQLLRRNDKALTISQRKLCFCFSDCTIQPPNLYSQLQQKIGIKHYLKRRSLLDTSISSLCETRKSNYSSATSKFSIKNDMYRKYIESLVSEYNVLHEKHNRVVTLTKDEHQKYRKLALVKETFEEVLEKYEEWEELQTLQTDDEMKELAAEEKELCDQQIAELEETLVDLLIPEATIDESDIILEVESGAGGQEAMLFALSVFEMYQQHAAYKGWEFKQLGFDATDLGGIRSASASISGPGVYREMKYEGGVHRVQRVPVTERGGRIHTSTISVAILPQPQEIDLTIHPKDLKVETMAGATSGGQHAQKNETCVRMTHIPTVTELEYIKKNSPKPTATILNRFAMFKNVAHSMEPGMVAFCSQERSQIQNKKLALAVLRTRLYNKKIEEERGQVVSQRKIQVGLKNRSEKIRTYNFPQGRITDHRIGRSVFNIDIFMAGGAGLDSMIREVLAESRIEELEEMVEQFERQTQVKTRTGKKI